ncbi:hypothetical protein RHSP_44994 [Rhizobium freirei PRF 81]|uniref:Uncharacterized protein n=1 Tax=Rhizobium freirei PRF 81 TaxID=363754 RepID=N6U4U3_9HYPH|nr:hypothetical protein RHSP_44994 [Rhizobium freirei PRF 81]
MRKGAGVFGKPRRSPDRAVFAFLAQAFAGRGVGPIPSTCKAAKEKPPMQSHGGASSAELRLDRVSADVIGANEADRAEVRVELLQAALGAPCRQLAIPGNLDGILSVEDEEH